MEVEGGRAVIVPEDRGDEDEDEDEDEDDGQEVNWTATDSHEGGTGRPGLAVGRVVGGKRRTTATGSQQPGERLNKHSNPSFPSPQVSRLPCAVPTLPGGQGHWTAGSGHRSARISARTTPPSPLASPLHPARHYIFATAICAVSLGVGSKLMGLVRFPSLTFFFFSFLLFLCRTSVGITSPLREIRGDSSPTAPTPWPASRPPLPLSRILGGSVKSHSPRWTLDTACLHLCVGGSATAQLSVPGPCQRAHQQSSRPSCVVSSEAHDENPTGASLVPKNQPSKTACQQYLWI
jgi:hypothetical protein